MYSVNDVESGKSISFDSFDDCISHLDEIIGEDFYTITVDAEMPNVWWVSSIVTRKEIFMITSMQKATQVQVE